MNWTHEQVAAYEARRNHNRLISDKATKLGIVLPEPAAMTLQPTTDESKLNKTERAYLAWLKASAYDWIGVQCITLKLADDCRYTCDFFVMDRGELIGREVKGFWRDDAKVKIKVAARMYPWIRFEVVTKGKGGFEHEQVKP